jgi:hypothetical protein
MERSAGHPAKGPEARENSMENYITTPCETAGFGLLCTYRRSWPEGLLHAARNRKILTRINADEHR